MDVVIVGAGGYGREILDILRHEVAEWTFEPAKTFVGFIDDGTPDPARLERIGATQLGGSERLTEFSGCAYVVGIANPQVRARLSDLADAAGLRATTLVHPSSTIGRDVILGPGTVVSAGARLTTNIRVGRHGLINQNVTIGHDTTLEDLVTLNPQASISGDVYLESYVTVGTTASINQGLRVGAGSVIGAGAAVVNDVPSGAVVVGVPAVPI